MAITYIPILILLLSSPTNTAIFPTKLLQPTPNNRFRLITTIEQQLFIKLNDDTKTTKKVSPCHDTPLKISPLNFTSLKFTSKTSPNYLNLIQNITLPNNLSMFTPKFTPSELQTGLNLLHIISHVFKNNSVEWWLSHKTLLGQQYFQSVVPWRDQLEISVLENNKRIFQLLNDFCRQNKQFKIVGISHQIDLHFKFFQIDDYKKNTNSYKNKEYTNSYKNTKNYKKNTKKIKTNAGLPNEFPYIKITSMKIKGDFVVSDSKEHKKKFKFKDVFPLQLGVFEKMGLPIPRNPLRILRQMFFDKKKEWTFCSSGHRHKMDIKNLRNLKGIHFEDEKSVVVPCKELWKYFFRIDFDEEALVAPDGRVVYRFFQVN